MDAKARKLLRRILDYERACCPMNVEEVRLWDSQHLSSLVSAGLVEQRRARGDFFLFTTVTGRVELGKVHEFLDNRP